MDTQGNLIDLFNQYFEVIHADTREKKEECFRLRYKVLCEELQVPGFEAARYSEKMESDQYDDRSIHYLMMHKPTNKIAGTVRIIIAKEESDSKFPLEQVAGASFFPDFLSCQSIPRSRIGEISRLILAPEFRARKGEDEQSYGVSEHVDLSLQQSGRRQSSTCQESNNRRGRVPRRNFPHAALGLFVAIVKISFERNLNYWYGGMEPVCARFLRSFGINFTPITPIVEYHGLRRGYFGNIPDIMENICQVNSQVWELLTDNGVMFPPLN